MTITLESTKQIQKDRNKCPYKSWFICTIETNDEDNSITLDFKGARQYINGDYIQYTQLRKFTYTGVDSLYSFLSFGDDAWSLFQKVQELDV